MRRTRPTWYRRAVGRFSACGLLAMFSPVCGLCAPETEDATTAFLTAERYQLFDGLTLPVQASLRLIPTLGAAPFTYDWSVTNPSGASADNLLDSLEGSTARLSPSATPGPYEILGTVTDATGIQSTSRIVLHVGPASGLATTSPRVGVVAGGGSEGQATIRLDPKSGTPPYQVTWTAIGPDGRVDDDRIDATSALSPRFTAAEELGTYILTADIVDAGGDKFTETVTAVVRERSLLDVFAERSTVLPGGGANGMLGLLATLVGGIEPFEYDWEIIGPDGERHTDLLWDSQVRDPTFESGDLAGNFRVRCAATDATGRVMIGSTTIEVSEKMALEILPDRFALVPGDATEGQATLVADVRGGVDPVTFDWQVSGPGGEDFMALLSSAGAPETVFEAGDQPGTYVVRCMLSDARGETVAEAVALTVGESLGVAVSADRTSPAIRGTTGQDTAQLTARAYGGTPPYTYQWSALDPNGERAQSLLDATSTQNPRFTGSVVLGPHAVYCKVTDAVGALAVDSTTLNVGQQLNVEVAADVQKLTANDGIGDLAQLVARVQGGVPPYSYHWEATDSFGFTADSMLSDARAANPVVTGNTQANDTYRFTLTLTDALEATFVDFQYWRASGQGPLTCEL